MTRQYASTYREEPMAQSSGGWCSVDSSHQATSATFPLCHVHCSVACPYALHVSSFFPVLCADRLRPFLLPYTTCCCILSCEEVSNSASTFSKPHVRKRSSAHLRKPRPGTLATPRRQQPCRSHTPDFTTSTASTATRPGPRSQSFALRTRTPPARRSPPWLPPCSRIHRQPTQQTAPGNSRAPQPTYLSNSHPTYHDTRSNPAKTPTNKAASSPSRLSTKASTPAPPPAQS